MSSKKTEQPTAKRLREARKKGQVFKSADLTQACLLLAAAGVLSLTGGLFVSQMKSFLSESSDPRILSGAFAPGALLDRVGDSFIRFFVLTLPLLATLVLVALAANFAQVRPLFSAESLSLKFERLNPATGFQNIFFKSKTYIEFAKTLLKVLVVLWMAYVIMHGMFSDMLQSGRLSAEQFAALGARAFFSLLYAIAAVYLLIGVADFSAAPPPSQRDDDVER